MKNKSAKISTDQLFFSHTWNFLNVYLVKQVGRSQATAESYRDSLTIFKNYLVDELGKSISTFQFSDCTKVNNLTSLLFHHDTANKSSEVH